MSTYLQELQDLYRTELGKAALAYLEVGLALFHGGDPDQTGSRIKMDWDFQPHPQTAVGNLAIAVELMLKAFAASKQLLLLFKDLPLEVRTILACQDNLPSDFNWRSFDIDLRSANYKNIDFSECIAIFYIFYPEWRWLESYLRLLKDARNTSLHAFLPSFQQYESEQAARVALQIHDILHEAQLFGQNGYKYSYLDEVFVNRFDEEGIQRVRTKIDQAKKRSKSINDSSTKIIHALADWGHFVIPCPVCQCDCMLAGETQLHSSEFGFLTVDGRKAYQNLSFVACSLNCSHCGLVLSDGYELRQAGVDMFYDRSDEIDLYLQSKSKQTPD